MNARRLEALLGRARRLVLLAETARTAGLALAVLGGAVLLAFVMDALLALSPGWLIAVNGLFVALLLAVAVWGARQIWRRRLSPRALARRLERRLGLGDSRLINAVDLSAEARRAEMARGEARGPASPELVGATIRGGDEAAAAIAPAVAVEARPLRRATAIAAAVVGLALVLHLAAPGLFASVSRRYLHPGAMHPPFTTVQFDVEITPEVVYSSRPATIRARLSGRDLPERADVVFLDEMLPNSVPNTVPMLRALDPDAGLDGAGAAATRRQFVLEVDRAERSREFYISTPSGRSATYTLEVRPVPLFEEIVVGYEFPAYTGWGTSRRGLDADGLRALTGTSVELDIASNVALAEGWLELEPAPKSGSAHDAARIRLTPHPDDDRRVRGRFELAFDGRFRLSLVGADGTPGDRDVEGALAATPDRPPLVEITSPAPHIVVPEAWAVHVAVAARDDVGLARIELSRSVNGWGPEPIELARESDRPGRARASYLFDLPALGAAAGDVISYYATAHDTHPGGAGFTDTETWVIEVISDEEYEEFARSQYRMEEIRREVTAFNRRLERLKTERDRLLEEAEAWREAAEAAGEAGEAAQERLRELEENLASFADEARHLAADMAERAERESLYEFEEPLRERLRDTAEQLQRQAENAEGAAEQAPPARRAPRDAGAREKLKDALERFERDAAPFDQAAQAQRRETDEDLEAIEQADRMQGLAEAIRQSIFAQRDLADRLAGFRGRDDLEPTEALRAHRLAEEQDRLREALAAAQENLRETAEAAEERLPRMCKAARGLCSRIDEMGVGEDQRAAASLARVGLGDDAHEAAERAAANLETLLSDCQGMGAEGEQDLDGCLSLPRKSMGNSLRQLAQGRQAPGLGAPSQGQQGQGQQGSGGFAGSRAPIQVQGPHVAGRGSTEEEATMSGVAGVGGTGAGEGGDGRPGAERLDPGRAEGARAAAAATWGVPVPYRDQAEAYFRRLADDERNSED